MLTSSYVLISTSSRSLETLGGESDALRMYLGDVNSDTTPLSLCLILQVYSPTSLRLSVKQKNHGNRHLLPVINTYCRGEQTLPYRPDLACKGLVSCPPPCSASTLLTGSQSPPNSPQKSAKQHLPAAYSWQVLSDNSRVSLHPLIKSFHYSARCQCP